MKEATNNFIKNASEVDKEITEEIWKDFLAQLVIFQKTAQDKALQNYTNTSITNITQKAEFPECAEYCNGDIRTIFEQYKLYHGYVALIVCCCFFLQFYLFQTICLLLTDLKCCTKHLTKCYLISLKKTAFNSDVYVIE